MGSLPRHTSRVASLTDDSHNMRGKPAMYVAVSARDAIPFKAHFLPTSLRAGDMIAIYAGNPQPSHVATVTAAPYSHWDVRETHIETNMGKFTVPTDSQIWVVAYAPLPSIQPIEG